MKFTITPHITASRMLGRSALSRSGLSAKLPLSLSTRGAQSQRRADRAEWSSAANTSAERSWKDRYLEQVKEQAKKDCAAGVHMGDDYQALEKECMAKYVSSSPAVAQSLFRRESAQVYTAAWNEAKAAQSSPSEESGKRAGFDRRV